MKWLIAIFAAIAAGAVAKFLRRKNPGGVWTRSTETTSSFGKNVADKAASAATAAATRADAQ